MAISKLMEEAIRKKDICKIHSFFYTILLSDPGFNQDRFENTLKEVKEYDLEGFIQEYNGIPFKEETEWNQEYWNDLASELMDNFCLERIVHIKKVGKKLYPAKKQTERNVKKPSKKKKEKSLLEKMKKILLDRD